MVFASGSDRVQPASQPVEAAERIASLDLIRGVAVLGILASNIVTYARPNEARRVLALVHQVTWTEWLPWLVNYMFVDGKFRGMFAALFGVGLVVFMDRARARRAPARSLQLRRLLWLMMFGAAHFVLLFEGDILLQYAMLGCVAVWVVYWNPRLLLWLGILLVTLDSTLSSLDLWQPVAAERVALSAPAGSKAREDYQRYWQDQRSAVAAESRVMSTGSLGDILVHRFARDGRLDTAAAFDPAFSLRWGAAGIAFSAVVALVLGLWLMRSGWPFDLNYFVFYGPVHVLRLPMIFGYLAVLVVLAPRWLSSGFGRRLEAAGQMALSNYLGTSVVMALVFQGWGLGWFDRFDRLEQWGFLLLGCGLMLAWSRPWLARCRFGPLEWAWRCLTYWRLFPLRRD